MAKAEPTRKRKAVTRDSPESATAALFDELGNGPLDAVFSQSEDESGSVDEDELFDEEEEDEEEDDIDSDEVPELDEEKLLQVKATNGSARTITDLPRRLMADDVASDDEDSTPNYTISTDANGNPRYVYREIEPVYDSDDSDAPATGNTIGNIPLSFYESYPHIGYDINGKRVMRPAKGAALDMLLDSIEIPQGWTGLTDPATGKPLQLSAEELDVLKRLTRNEVPEEGYDPYPEMVEYFTGRVEQMPLSAAPEPKRRFVPSKHEAKRVMKIVKAIKEGRIKPYRPPEELAAEEEDQDPDTKRYDIWADEAPRPDHIMNIPAPKLPPPGYDESYHPPPEYIPDAAEKAAWDAADESDREKEYLPTDHSALRRVPGYARLVKERFERCLDLYLAPRVRRSKLNIDPESLLPKLPSPEELRPFPSRCARVFAGHKGRVRSVAIDPSGLWLASGGDDGTARVWKLDTGREVWRANLGGEDADPVNVVKWRPGNGACVLAACAGDTVYLIAPELPSPSDDPEKATTSRELLTAGFANPSSSTSSNAPPTKETPARWTRPAPRLAALGVHLSLTVRGTIKSLAFHRRGDYFTTVSPSAASASVAIHTLSAHKSQLPFRRLKGLAQAAAFHPSKPVFFVATQRSIRAYDLARQELIKILQPGARWISGFDVHPGGDNLVVGSFDRRLLWMDMDLSSTPYKTLRYHSRGIRAVRFHAGGYPLFADASDDGTVQVFHGKVVDDMMQNASIVPLKVLKGHKVEGGLGVLDVEWHPREPVLVSAGADGVCRLWQ